MKSHLYEGKKFLINQNCHTSIKSSALLVSLLLFSIKLQQLLKKTKFNATEMSLKILNHIFGRPKMLCKKLEENVWMG